MPVEVRVLSAALDPRREASAFELIIFAVLAIAYAT
jgi:hypothetical protein